MNTKSLSFEEFDSYLLSKKAQLIHSIWFGTIPNRLEAKKAYKKLAVYRNSWLLKNPEWFCIEWNKSLCIQLVKTYYPEHNILLAKYKHEIQRCDAMRYLILHRYGGWYVDADYYCNRPLNEVHANFPHDIYLVQSPNSVIGQDEDHVSNSLMYSRPNHPFWRQLLIEMEMAKNTSFLNSKHIQVMFTTGPGILNKVYHKYKIALNVKSLPYKLFHPYGINDEKTVLNVGPEVYAVHLGKGSWEGKDSKFFLFWARHWGIALFIILGFLLPQIIGRMVRTRK